jgi:hypothetical protein
MKTPGNQKQFGHSFLPNLLNAMKNMPIFFFGILQGGHILKAIFNASILILYAAFCMLFQKPLNNQ